MNSVKIYDDVLTKDDLEFIKENYFTESKTSAIDILCELDNFLKKEILYSLAFDFDNSIINPCIAHAIIMETYNIENKDAVLWEPHHDGNESKVITLIFVDREDTNQWTGGELDVYTSLNAFDYPDNKMRIEPIPGRIVVFDSSQVHCIRPYFGTAPRKSISIGWE